MVQIDAPVFFTGASDFSEPCRRQGTGRPSCTPEPTANLVPFASSGSWKSGSRHFLHSLRRLQPAQFKKSGRFWSGQQHFLTNRRLLV